MVISALGEVSEDFTQEGFVKAGKFSVAADAVNTRLTRPTLGSLAETAAGPLVALQLD